MYLELFKLKEFPFRLSPDTDFLYLSQAHTRAKAYMDYTIWAKEGFVVITGDIGCGKTILIKKLLDETGESVLVARIFQTQLNEVEFLQAVLVEFGLNPFSANKVELLDMLNTFIINAHNEFNQIVLIVDEAQNLGASVLEEIRMLTSLETHKEKLLSVILVGQPELIEKIESPELNQLLQRVRLRYHIGLLTEKETREYINHRLKIAGSLDSDIFNDDVFGLIFRYTGGTPRLINTLCDTAMICAYADTKNKVSKKTIETAIKELNWRRFKDRKQCNHVKSSARVREGADEIGSIVAPIMRKLDQLNMVSEHLTYMRDVLVSIDKKLSCISGADIPKDVSGKKIKRQG